MSRELEIIAREIDPMAWKAWEITDDIDTRRKVSVEKARTALQMIRTPSETALAPGVTALAASENADRPTVASAVWAAIIDEITVRKQ